MGSDTDHDAMIDACIAAAEHVNRSGTPEQQAVMRVLLLMLAREITERTSVFSPDD